MRPKKREFSTFRREMWSKRGSLPPKEETLHVCMNKYEYQSEVLMDECEKLRNMTTPSFATAT